jgi:glycosyltransferase involved in cell wall biosynthesis
MGTPVRRLAAATPAPVVVLHAALFPRCGVWAHLKELTLWQADRGLRPALALFFDDHAAQAAWLAENRAGIETLERAGVPCGLETVRGVTSATKGLAIRFGVAAHLRRTARQLAARHRPAQLVLHCHTSFLFGYLLPFDAAVGCPVRVVTALHGVHPASARYDRGLRNLLYGALLRRCLAYSTVVSVDEGGAQNCACYFGVDARRILVVHNGVPVPRVPPSLTRSPAAPVRFGFIGRLDRRKGWDVLLQAFERGIHRGADWQLVVAGNGTDEASVRSRLEALGTRVRFLGYVLRPEDEFYPEVDVLVLPSQGEGFPMAALEAGARGIPIIATRVGGLGLIVREGRTGLAVECDDVEGLCAAMRTVDDAGTRRQMSRAMREHIAAHFSIDACGDRWASTAYGLPSGAYGLPSADGSTAATRCGS